MKNYKEIQITTQQLISTTCDKCGEVAKEYDYTAPEMASFRHTFGFGSPRDGTTIAFDLCEKCLQEVIEEADINTIVVASQY